MPSHSNISAITLCSHPISVITRSCTSAITLYPFCVLIIYAVPSHFLVAFLYQYHHTVLFFLISAITLHLSVVPHYIFPYTIISAITHKSHHIKCHHTFVPLPSHCTLNHQYIYQCHHTVTRIV